MPAADAAKHPPHAVGSLPKLPFCVSESVTVYFAAMATCEVEDSEEGVVE